MRRRSHLLGPGARKSASSTFSGNIAPWRSPNGQTIGHRPRTGHARSGTISTGKEIGKLKAHLDISSLAFFKRTCKAVAAAAMKTVVSGTGPRCKIGLVRKPQSDGPGS